MILSQSQAEAVYSAMCALNNVSHTYLRTNFGAPHGKRISVAEVDEGISIKLYAFQGNPVENTEAEEVYDNQASFATAYGLNSDATPLVCSECQGRGEVETGIGMMVCTECPAR